MFGGALAPSISLRTSVAVLVRGTAGAAPGPWAVGSDGPGPVGGPCGPCAPVVRSPLGSGSWFRPSSAMGGRTTGAGRIPCAAVLMRWQTLAWWLCSARGVRKLFWQMRHFCGHWWMSPATWATWQSRGRFVKRRVWVSPQTWQASQLVKVRLPSANCSWASGTSPLDRVSRGEGMGCSSPPMK